MNDKTIKMFLGSKKIIINGKENTLDVPAQTIKDRTIIPLRALVEALGKNVFWDDRGLIVISNEENLFDIEKEMDLIDEAIELFSY